MLSLEEFLKAHQYTVAALGVLGTFSAVVVSLATSFVALRASRTRIRARASINIISHISLKGKEKPKYFVISIRNIGNAPVMIPMSHFSWRLPFARSVFTIMPLDYSQSDQWIPQRKYPAKIKPRSSEIFFLSEIQMFREYAQKDLIGSSFLSRLRSRFVKGRVFTEDGKLFDAVFDSSLRKELSDLRNKTRQQEPGRPSADLGAMD